MSTFVRRAALAVLLSTGFGAANAQVVVSQVWGSAGSPGAAYDRDYVELFNRGNTAVPLAGLSLQYQAASANGNYSVLGVLPNISLQPGQRFLVGLASGAGGTALPTPDIDGSTDIGITGKLVLATGLTRLRCSHGAGLPKCTLSDPSRVVDMVGYGPTANDFEGIAPAVSPIPADAIFRLNDGATDTDENSTDFARAAANPRNSGDVWTPTDGTPVAMISDTTADEGNSGTTPFFFTISLSAPAGAGGVSVDYATADLTATVGSDYVAASGTATIAPGATSVTVSVDVNGDYDLEATEIFTVNLSNASGALIFDGQASGIITNDDFPITPIHTIQGSGAASPLAGNSVHTRGIVTGRKNNGFFIQTADADADADAATSQGLFVFTSSTPPAAAAVGNFVQVSGTVTEFVPAADLQQAPMTELVSPTVVATFSTGNALPTAVSLTPALPSPAGAIDQLEAFEGMRVTADSFTVVAPTRGSINQIAATGGSNGIFSVVVTSVARPFREAGIQLPDAEPVGNTATSLPRWDFNPELITVDSDALGGLQLNLPAGAVLTNLVGPLDFGFRRYTLLADAATTVGVASVPAPTAARAPTADEFTLASYNLQRFFDDVDDAAITDPVLTAVAFDRRLGKASLAIRDYLHAPDVLGAVEVENLATLQALAQRISADAIAAGQPDPMYVAYLEEGNDVGGIDVGFLVKTAEASAGVARVEVDTVTQLGKDTTWLDPSDSTQHLLNDRPPLLLEGVVHFADGRQVPVSVVVVHQRSLDGIASEDADGATSEGDRVRQKRQQQAEFLAGQIQARQVGNPDEHIAVLGDFNAFEFNDGYADIMGVMTGSPADDDTTAVSGDGADLVDPNLANLASFEDVGQRYSYVFDGSAQSLDHVLANQALAANTGVDFDHARINADFPENARSDGASPARLSDHDPLIAYFSIDSADLSVVASAAPSPVLPGEAMGFDVAAANAGPTGAQFPGVGFAFDAELPDLTIDAPAGWTCDTPTVLAGTTIASCSAASLANAGTADFHLAANAPMGESGNAISMAASIDAGTFDPDLANNSDSASTDVTAVADLDVMAGGRARTATMTSYLAVVTNIGPLDAEAAQVLIQAQVPAAAASVVAPAGWTCAPTGAVTFAVLCDIDAGSMASGTDSTFQFNVTNRYDKSQYRLSVSAQSDTVDMVPGNNTVVHRLMPTL